MIEVVPCHMTRLGIGAHEFQVLKDGLLVYPSDMFKQTCCVPKVEAKSHADSIKPQVLAIMQLDRPTQIMVDIIREWTDFALGVQIPETSYEEAIARGAHVIGLTLNRIGDSVTKTQETQL